MATTYSFGDISLVLQHPTFGSYTAMGEGLGSITVSMANDVSYQDLAADGAVMTSKVKADNGTVQLVAQQTSSLNKFLTNLYNFVKTAPAAEWEGLSMLVKAPTIEQTTDIQRMSFQKFADKPYQQQGQQVTWSFLAASIQHGTV